MTKQQRRRPVALTLASFRKIKPVQSVTVILILGVTSNLASLIYLFTSPLLYPTSTITFAELAPDLPGVFLFLLWSLLPYLILRTVAKRVDYSPAVVGAGITILGLDLIFSVAILLSANAQATAGFIFKPVWMLLLLPVGFFISRKLVESKPGRAKPR